MKTLMITLALVLAAPLASATGRTVEDSILNHSVVKAVGELLNRENNDQCKLPTQKEDIQWMCMGALFPPTKPTLVNTGCGFVVEINCKGKVTSLFGQTKAIQLLLPSGQFSSEAGIISSVDITDVQLR